MSDAEFGNQEEELVPLFTLSPQAPTRERHSGAPTDDRSATFQRHHTFGYDCRLDDDYRPGGDYDYEAQGFKPRNEKSRRMIGAGVVMAFLGAAALLIATQPATRDAVGSAASHFFGGSNGGSPVVAPPTATANVLSIDTPQSTPAADPTPSAGATQDPLAGSVGGPVSTPAATIPTPVATAAPTAVAPATSDPATAAPIHVTGSVTPAAGGKTTTTCQAGKMTANTCTWQVSVQQGYPMYATLSWSGAATMEMTVTDTAGNPLFSQSSATGTIATNIANPPSTVFIACTVQAGSAQTKFDLGLAAHPF